MSAAHQQLQRIPIISVDDVPSHVDIMQQLAAATSVADADQQIDDVIGRQQSQRQRWVDRLDAAMESGLEADELWTVVRSDKPLCDWTVSWALDRGVDVSDRYLGNRRTVSVYVSGKTLIIVSERIDTTGPVQS